MDDEVGSFFTGHSCIPLNIGVFLQHAAQWLLSDNDLSQ